MARPLNLYNHTHAPNPRRVRIFAAEQGSLCRWKRLIFWPGKAACPNFSRETRQVPCRYSNSMTVHAFPNRWQFAGIWKGFNLNPISWAATYANRRRSRGGIAGWNLNCLLQSDARFKIRTRSFKGVLSSFRNMARRSERSFLNASNEWITNWTDMSSLRATALLSPISRRSSRSISAAVSQTYT
jgi:hypothetical protein